MFNVKRILPPALFLAIVCAVQSAIGQPAGDRPKSAVEKAKVSFLQAIDLAKKAVPDSRVARLELHGHVYEVVLVTKSALLAVEIDAATGKAGEAKPAEMDDDKFQNSDEASKAMTAAKISLADAVRKVEEKEKGKACEAELKLVRGQPRYEVKVVGEGGSAEIMIDGITGEVIPPRPRADDSRPYRDSFPVDKKNLSSIGRNPYFILEPGYRCQYEGGNETVVISVLNDTKTVDGVETRVVEEREEKNGKLAEVSRNYFAIDKTTNDVYYFGEDVDIYRNEKVVDHEGAWLSGVGGAKFGLLMPGTPKVGDRFYQELAPKVAMDRAVVVSLDESMKTPAGVFDKCLYVVESTPLERGKSKKWYAAGIGLVRDDEQLLVKVEKPKP